MCVSSDKCKTMNRSQLGKAVRGVLTRAKVENRLICGLPAISYLEKSPEEVLLCVLPQNRAGGDATTHMQTVLLQAFCYENFIPMIQVDNRQKFGEYCGVSSSNFRQTDCLCAIVVRNCNLDLDNVILSYNEQFLMDFYECTLEEFPRPVVELPG